MNRNKIRTNKFAAVFIVYTHRGDEVVYILIVYTKRLRCLSARLPACQRACERMQLC